MERKYLEDESYDKVDFSDSRPQAEEYDNCIFRNCNFSNVDLAKIHFSECVFEACNFSMAKLAGTAFKNVRFQNCKLLGLHFESCNSFLFEIYVEDCVLNLSSFYGLKIKKTGFSNSILREVDFTDADLSSSVFDNCDLAGAIFENTNLEKANLLTSYNYIIDPELNRIKKARFSLTGVAGLLNKYDIDIE